MIFKSLQVNILVRVLLLSVSIAGVVYLLMSGYLIFAGLVIAILAWQVTEFYRFQLKMHRELQQFVESIHYRDFSRNFDVRNASSDVKSLREGFNEINSAFKLISRERETQYQYLQHVVVHDQ